MKRNGIHQEIIHAKKALQKWDNLLKLDELERMCDGKNEGIEKKNYAFLCKALL